MFEKLIRAAIEHRWLVLLAAIGMAAVGVFSYQKLPIDAVPDITNNQVQVNPLNGTIFHYHEYKEFRHELRAFFSHYQGAPAHVLAQHTLRLHPQIRMQPKIAFYQLPRWRRSLFQKFGKTWTPLPLPWESQAPPRQC